MHQGGLCIHAMLFRIGSDKLGYLRCYCVCISVVMSAY